MKKSTMKSYVPPHKRSASSNQIDFNTPWINNDKVKNL